ncbi:MAG: type III polyketide synthase [Proteobacteria bacterium]|nr:type III polyketide synthase [Pseudomonadota bacterium]MCP4921362.1 type III polyketide synthase [Pseudomonadota bacterium]
MQIASVGAAFPPNFYDQDQLIAAFREHWGKRHKNLDRIEKLHRNVLVGGRHLALPMEEYDGLERWGQTNDAWIRVAQQVGEDAVRDAVARSGVPWDRIGAFFSVTVTGVATPSLEARLMNRIPELPRSTKRIPIFGLGCVAGAAGISRAADYVKAYPNQAALLLSVELCSLTLQRDDLSIPNLISSGLFGDGGACAVLVGEELAAELGIQGPSVVDTRSVFYTDTERVMGWDISETGFKIVLSADVPKVVQKHLRADVDGFLAARDLSLDDISSYVCHPGGPKVLLAFEETLGIEREKLQVTWDSLMRVGNLSSSSVLMVLRETMSDHRPEAGSLGLMLAMGPAFCSEVVLLRW